jgi:hypothetical protein
MMKYAFSPQQSGAISYQSNSTMTTDQRLTLPDAHIGEFVADMARQHRIAYTRTFADAWGESVTRLSDDSVQTDEVEHLLIALKRAGKLSAADMVALLVAYLRERPKAHV